MKSSTSILLVAVLVVALVGFVALSKKPKPTAATGNLGISIDLTKAISGIGSWFGSSNTNAPSIANGKISPPGYVNQEDTQAQADYALRHDVVEQQGNQLVDVNTGGALVYGPN